ncbi:MAG: rhodanese-like domain-containing protein [Ilumatobacter fluminis]|uniref:rhodanese-like domain-containing protein n=1 Tax=Ilumatobacter fluminis TaxID=467091 RepID=UPI0032EAD1E6
MTITDTPAATTIHASELRQLRLEDPRTRILDVRTTSEFESVHIPGSYNVPLDQLAEHVDAVADLDAPVVLVCLSGNRAATAQEKLNSAGKTNLRVLDGGIGAWQTAGGDVVKGDEKWTLERQVRGVAGSIVLASILTSIKFPKARALAGGVGFGLLFSALSNTCAMGMLLAKLPYNRGPECVIDDVLADMRD